MTRRKERTSISISGDLLKALDSRARAQGRTRSDLVCEAVNRYFASEEERMLAVGYLEMATESADATGEDAGSWPAGWPDW
ncbi:MAG: CopG family ribbon-helix-helix protein [Thermoleophilia bacterium]